MEILNKIFGSATKVRLMRLFVLNPETIFSFDEIVDRTMMPTKEVKLELALLEDIDLIKAKKISRKDAPDARRPKMVMVWSVNTAFMYIQELQYFLMNANLVKHSELVKQLQRGGKIKSVIIAGVFLNEWEETRIDLLIVGDELKKSAIESTIRKIEAEVGRELRYTIFETADFKYRMSMRDKLIREVLEYPHQVLLDRVDLSR